VNRLPKISGNHKICIICEGNEEYKYLERLNELQVWNSIYDVSLINAEGNGNIPARYQDKYQSDSYEVVFVFCDTEKKPHEQYEDIKRKIDEFHGVDGVSDEVVIFGNPCTMQIITKHWTDEIIKSPAKLVNAPLIEKYTGISKYKGKTNQIEGIMKFINKENYIKMKKRIIDMPKTDSIDGSSNFDKLIKYLESQDCRWIIRLNDKLDQ
jgi:hypothetical protein